MVIAASTSNYYTTFTIACVLAIHHFYHSLCFSNRLTRQCMIDCIGVITWCICCCFAAQRRNREEFKRVDVERPRYPQQPQPVLASPPEKVIVDSRMTTIGCILLMPAVVIATSFGKDAS